MKKIFSLLLLLVFYNSNSQEHAFKFNPLSFAFNGAEISYEMMNESKSSSELVFGYITNKVKNSDETLTAYAFELRYKFLVSKDLKSFEGYYIAPIGNIIIGKVTNKYATPNDLSALGVGVLGGYQFIFQNKKENGFLLDLNAGLVYNFVKSQNLDISNIKGIRPRLGISLGYAF